MHKGFSNMLMHPQSTQKDAAGGGDCHLISEEQAIQDQLVGRWPQRSTGRRYLPTGVEDADTCPRRREGVQFTHLGRVSSDRSCELLSTNPLELENCVACDWVSDPGCTPGGMAVVEKKAHKGPQWSTCRRIRLSYSDTGVMWERNAVVL